MKPGKGAVSYSHVIGGWGNANGDAGSVDRWVSTRCTQQIFDHLARCRIPYATKHGAHAVFLETTDCESKTLYAYGSVLFHLYIFIVILEQETSYFLCL